MTAFILSFLASCSDTAAEAPDDTTLPDDTTVKEEPPREMLTLIADDASDYVIVHGEDAYISEITAATELQSYLKQMTGVELQIVTDAAAPTEKEIVVGKTNREAEGEFDREELGDDGLVIKTVGKKLFIVGGEQRGTLFGVYEFLESYLGCRFYTNDFEKVPETDTVAIEVIAEEDKQIPVLEFRCTSAYVYKSELITVKRKLNSRYSLPEEYGGYNAWVKWVHSHTDLVPPKTYYDEHPEYYSIGLTDKNDASYLQLCLTNPEVLEIAIESTRKLLNKKKDDPNYKVISISQEDNQDYCTCDNCKALAEAEGSYAAATVMFVNNIATALKDEFPNITFETLAYTYTRNAPLTVKPADNVIIRLCTIEECFSHPISDHPENVNTSDALVKTSFTEDIAQWSELTDKLYIWDYVIDWYEFHAPYPNFEVLLDNIRFFVDNGVVGVYEESTSGTICACFNDLRLYLISKVLWDPYMTEEEFRALADEFLRDVYGEGWVYLREYLDLMERCSEPYCFGTFDEAAALYGFNDAIQKNEIWTVPETLTADIIRDYENVNWSEYWNYYSDIVDETPEIITKGYELFEKAYAAAETDLQRDLIEMESIQAYVIDSCYRAKKVECGEGGIKRMLNNFYSKNKDAFTMQERTEYSKKISTLAKEQVTSELVIFNTALRELMIKHGIKNTALDKTALTDEPIEDTDLDARPSHW
ncbi:MAG: DUF4838 domain-containing protein [Clostridia bacterium]|nr:DUF4838 domain-containing protein [Clostridia bacterium]